MPLSAGQIVYESDLLGLNPDTVYKGASTTRNNTASLANDPDLANIQLDPGTYSIKVTLFTTNANAAAKLKTRWSFTGTWTSPMRSCVGPGSTNTSTDPGTVTPATFRGYDATSQDAVYSYGVSSAYAAIEETCDFVQVTASGVFAVQWAQNVATAANTIIQPGSSVRVTKVV